MTPTPDVKPLSRNHRRIIFVFSILTFVVVVPLLVFYAVGYRVDLSGETRNIKTVGGMYISADANDISIYVDDEPVEDMRIFQNAAYIQNLDAGLHQVHVQGEDINTWVKSLPVYSHFVTEGASFNLPIAPQIRLITEYTTADDNSVVAREATTTFAFASTTNVFYATTSKATTTYKINPEYTYLSTLMASSAEEKARRLELETEAEIRFQFSQSATTSTSSLEVSTTTKTRNNIVLRENGDDVEALWLGRADNIPYYFCVTYSGPMATRLAYGNHVYDDLVTEFSSTTDLTDKDLIGERLCRETVALDRKWQQVQYFNFLPGSDHLVLLQLQDGVYVVEIDDRSWQNVQLLYPGDYLEVVVDSGSIFIKDREYILEVLTDLSA